LPLLKFQPSYDLARLQNFQTGSGSHPDFYSVDPGVTSPGDNTVQGEPLTVHTT